MAGMVITAAVYAAAVAQQALGVLPPWNWWSALPVAVGFALLWAVVDRLARSRWLTGWQTADEPPVDVVALRD
jgi:uncharacterized membrane protein YbhN (UPF0104 family)